jgi:hypothetical protein
MICGRPPKEASTVLFQDIFLIYPQAQTSEQELFMLNILLFKGIEWGGDFKLKYTVPAFFKGTQD